MREILFKAKRLSDGEWVEGSLLADEFGSYYIGTFIFSQESKIESDGRSNGKTFRRFNGIGFVQVDVDTICQYTGLTDKNGNKIWENDILYYHDTRKDNCVVKFGEYSNNGHNKHIGFYVDWETYSFMLRQDLGFWANERGIRVIGNIFDNPELLEETE